MKRAIQVVIADDHPIFRIGLQQLMIASPEIQVIETASDGKIAFQIITQLKPHIAILDVEMPGMNGLEVAARLRDELSATRVIALTGHKDLDIFNQAMDAGVRGYVLKESAVHDIRDAVVAVAAEQYYISPQLSGFMLQRRGAQEKLRKERPGLDQLTQSEQRILRLIAQNKTSKEIATQLGISARTVENHRANICAKLKLRGIHSLVKFAFDNKSKLGLG